MEIDDVFLKIGEFGLYQKRAFFGSLLIGFFCGTVMLQNIFAGAVPTKKACAIPAHLPACHEHCRHISYPEDDFVSFATEWHMTCGADIAVSHTTQTIYMFGITIGSFFMGSLADTYGRLPILLISQCLCSLFGLGSSFATDWTTYVSLRFLTGFFMSGISISYHVLTTELVGPSKRGLIATMPGIAFSFGLGALSFTAWITRNWRTMSAVIGIFGVAVVLPVLYYVYDESPRWHLARGNMEKCEDVLHKIARTNDHEMDAINLKVRKSSIRKESQGSMLSLFRNSILCKITLIQLFSWFSVSSVYYGLTIASGEAGSNRYVSVFFSALLEIPSNIIITVVMNLPSCGRVRSCVFGLMVSSLFCGAIWFIDEANTTAILLLACTGKFFIVASFAIIYVQATELYPTPVRNCGLGIVSVFNRIGGTIAPQIVNLNNVSHNSHFLVFGILGCLSGAFCSLLPETLGRPLPSTPEDIYKRVKYLEKDGIAIMDVGRQLPISGSMTVNNT